MTTVKIMVVEDDHDLAELFSMAVERAHIQPEVLSDGDKAMVALDAGEAPAILFLDLHLRGAVSGWDILSMMRQAKNRPRFEKTRVIVITADVHASEKIRGEVLVKPIYPSKITALVREEMKKLAPPSKKANRPRKK